MILGHQQAAVSTQPCSLAQQQARPCPPCAQVGWVARVGGHLGQAARDLAQRLSPARGGVGHHGEVVTHVAEVLCRGGPRARSIARGGALTWSEAVWQGARQPEACALAAEQAPADAELEPRPDPHPSCLRQLPRPAHTPPPPNSSFLARRPSAVRPPASGPAVRTPPASPRPRCSAPTRQRQPPAPLCLHPPASVMPV